MSTALAPRRMAPPAAAPAADPMSALLARRHAALAAVMRHQLATQHITVRWDPAAATTEERLSVAALLLAGTGFAITPTTEATS